MCWDRNRKIRLVNSKDKNEFYIQLGQNLSKERKI